MMRMLPYILVGLIVYMVLFYLQNYQPAVLTEVLIQVDVFGVTRVAEEEQARLAKIKNLTIPYEQKQVLVNRTVFIGADTEMVKLALGAPTKPPISKTELQTDGTAKTAISYIYFLPDDKRPTILVFEDDKLAKAYKGSAIDKELTNGVRQ